MTLKKSSLARCHNSTAAFATRWSHSQRSQAPRQSQTPEKIGVKLHRSIGGQPERGGDKIGVNSCYMLYYIILYLYCMISYYIILCYILYYIILYYIIYIYIYYDAAEPSSNTQITRVKLLQRANMQPSLFSRGNHGQRQFRILLLGPSSPTCATSCQRLAAMTYLILRQ